MCVCDYESPSFVYEKVRRSRKRRRCEDCPAVIEPGDTYCSISGKWDMVVSRFVQCMRCHLLKEAMPPGFCWAYGNLTADVIAYVEWECGTPAEVGAVYGSYRKWADEPTV